MEPKHRHRRESESEEDTTKRDRTYERGDDEDATDASSSEDVPVKKRRVRLIITKP